MREVGDPRHESFSRVRPPVTARPHAAASPDRARRSRETQRILWRHIQVPPNDLRPSSAEGSRPGPPAALSLQNHWFTLIFWGFTKDKPSLTTPFEDRIIYAHYRTGFRLR